MTTLARSASLSSSHSSCSSNLSTETLVNAGIDPSQFDLEGLLRYSSKSQSCMQLRPHHASAFWHAPKVNGLRLQRGRSPLTSSCSPCLVQKRFMPTLHRNGNKLASRLNALARALSPNPSSRRRGAKSSRMELTSTRLQTTRALSNILFSLRHSACDDDITNGLPGVPGTYRTGLAFTYIRMDTACTSPRPRIGAPLSRGQSFENSDSTPASVLHRVGGKDWADACQFIHSESLF
jgi:hypothetical protein